MKPNHIARVIEERLLDFERDPTVNVIDLTTGRPIYVNPSALAAGKFIRIAYDAQVPTTPIVQVVAKGYLRWLRSGKVGTHNDYLQAIAMDPQGNVNPDVPDDDGDDA